jgi:tRNA U38,U39,U40 pseudouridine synthase TruA
MQPGPFDDFIAFFDQPSPTHGQERPSHSSVLGSAIFDALNTIPSSNVECSAYGLTLIFLGFYLVLAPPYHLRTWAAGRTDTIAHALSRAASIGVDSAMRVIAFPLLFVLATESRIRVLGIITIVGAVSILAQSSMQ